MKRRKYDAFLKDNPLPELPEEFTAEFAENASSEGEESGDDSDDDDPEEPDYPPPPDKVKGLHEKIGQNIQVLFMELSGPDPKTLAKINVRNQRIRKDNEKNKRHPSDLYEVHTGVLATFRMEQRRIALHFDTGLSDTETVKKDREKLIRDFNRVRSMSICQWPEDWIRLLLDPLDKKLQDLGYDVAMNDLSSDEDESDSEPDSEPNTEPDSESVTRRGEMIPTRALQPLRAGFTMLGDKILGYMPVERRSKIMPGESILTGFKMFVQVKETGLFKVASGNDVGNMAALAYHQLPEQQRNDIRKNTKKYSNTSSLEFSRILGVDWIPGRSQPGRLPFTYVWVEMKSKSQHADIMTRTTFRDWLTKGLADKLVDDWLLANKIVPEWSLFGLPTDPANDRKYLALTYPAPTMPRYDMRPRIQSDDTRPHIQSGDMQPRIQDGNIQALTNKFDQLLQLVIEDRKEAREERQQQQQMMRMLLPAPAK